MQKRLNLDFLMEDLREYLTEASHRGNDIEVTSHSMIDWLDNYEKQIQSNKDYIVSKFQEMFPKAFVKFEQSIESSLFLINIYGMIYDYGTNLSDPAHDLAFEIQKDFPCCRLIIDFTTLEDTKYYYPEIYEEFVKKIEPKNP